MKFKRIILISLLLAVITMGVVSAADDINGTDDVVSVDETEEISVDAEESDNLEADEDEEICSSGSDIELHDGDIFIIGDEEENYIDVDIDSEEDIYGKLTVKLNGTNVTLKDYNKNEDYFYIYNKNGSSVEIDENHAPSLCLDRLDPGIYNIEIIFEANKKKYSITKSATIQVVRPGTLTDITIGIEDGKKFVQGNPANIINITVPSNAINKLKVKINDENFAFVKTSNTTCYVNISQLDVGDYEIEATAGTTLYDDVQFEIVDSSGGLTGDFIGTITGPNDDFTAGSDMYISLKINGTATGNLVVTDDKGQIVFDEPLVNGTARFSLSHLTVGEYYFEASYTGDDVDVDDEEFEFSVVPIVTYPKEMTVGEKKYFTIDFVNNVNGMVVLQADGDEYKRVYLKGENKASISLADLDDSSIDLYLEYYEDDVVLFEEEYEIEVKSVKPRIIAKNVEMMYMDGTTFKVTVYGTNGKLATEDEYVEVKIGKEVYDIYTNRHGVATLKLKMLPGKYTVTTDYEDTIVKSTLVIKPVLVFKKVKVKKSAKKLVLKATLKKVKGKYLRGKLITFKFKGKKFKVKTNKKGVAKVKIKKSLLKKLKVGKKVKSQATYLKHTIKRTSKVKK
jgi:hypothetical protein